MIAPNLTYRLWKLGSRVCEAFADGSTNIAQTFAAGVRVCDDRAHRIKVFRWQRDLDERSKGEGRQP